MKYERLTTKDKNGNWQVWEDDYSHPFEALQTAIERLAELEDKIENGTLVVTNQPFVVLDYLSNGQEYYAVRIAEEKDLYINLTKAEAEKKLKELKGE